MHNLGVPSRKGFKVDQIVSRPKDCCPGHDARAWAAETPRRDGAQTTGTEIVSCYLPTIGSDGSLPCRMSGCLHEWRGKMRHAPKSSYPLRSYYTVQKLLVAAMHLTYTTYNQHLSRRYFPQHEPASRQQQSQFVCMDIRAPTRSRTNLISVKSHSSGPRTGNSGLKNRIQPGVPLSFPRRLYLHFPMPMRHIAATLG